MLTNAFNWFQIENDFTYIQNESCDRSLKALVSLLCCLTFKFYEHLPDFCDNVKVVCVSQKLFLRMLHCLWQCESSMHIVVAKYDLTYHSKKKDLTR